MIAQSPRLDSGCNYLCMIAALRVPVQRIGAHGTFMPIKWACSSASSCSLVKPTLVSREGGGVRGGGKGGRHEAVSCKAKHPEGVVESQV